MHVPIIKILKESIHDVRQNWLDWLRIFFAPLTLWISSVLLRIIVYGWVGQWSFEGTLDHAETQISGEYLWMLRSADVVCIIMNWLSSIVLSINGCRYAVLKERGKYWWTLQVNRRLGRQILYSTLISVLWWIYIGFSSIICLVFYGSLKNIPSTVILAIFLGFCGFCWITRLGLTYLLVSIDQKKPLKLSWNLMRGNVLRLTGCIILGLVAFFLIGLMGVGVLGAIGWLLYSINPWLIIIAMIPLVLFVFSLVFAFFAIEFKGAALTYKFLEAERSYTSTVSTE